MTIEEGLHAFGYTAFRPGQEKIVTAIMDGKDTLSIMPTGAGKSLCYQLPATLLPGITIVVSPLIALMHDQVMSLKKRGVPAAYINSTLTPAQFALAMQRAYMGAYKIIYVAPERLSTRQFLNFAVTQDISLLVIDEAHCVTQWGHAFRQAYMGIPVFVSRLLRRPIIAAFTATATADMQDDIKQNLALNSPRVTVTGFDRPNLYYSVEKKVRKDEWLKKFVEEHDEKCGVIYCRYRRTTEEVAKKLKDAGYSAGYFHAGLEAEEKRRVLEEFLSGKLQIITATTAFGMGIDKPDIRYVVHYDMPMNLEDYYQQAGRAGRDGKPAECVLLYSSKDTKKNLALIEESVKGAALIDRPRLLERETSRLNRMEKYALQNGCYRAELLRYFGETPSSENCCNCGNCKKK